MKTKEFLSRLDHERIVAAISAAEKTTSGEIRVFVQRGEMKGDALPLAERKFQSLGMQKTAERNAILIFVAPRAQKFAVVGDEGVHAKCGAEFWQALVDAMRDYFKRDAFTEAIVHGVERAGQLLARYFPRQSDDRDELSNEVIEG
ncbi:MAG: TPM domain-containing protein [Verrucomicrobiota bacterium]|nr:TPM domain-containing protein [Verrucomicrobiota bacterium]